MKNLIYRETEVIYIIIDHLLIVHFNLLYLNRPPLLIIIKLLLLIINLPLH